MSIKDIFDSGFRGNIAIHRNGEVLFERSSGLADLANRLPNLPDTRFASASAGKVFVAAGILRLAERGMLRLEDTLGALLSGVDLHEIDPLVTVKQLLTHTSGVPDYFDESVMEEYEELWIDFPNYRIRRNSDLLPLFVTKPMMYPRGERFQYNNSGYVLLAMIIEQVTGVDFEQYLREEIFLPCGMNDTGYFPLDRLPARCANSYIRCEDTDGYRTNIYSVDARGTGAGGAFITTGDIIAFWNGLLSGRIISKETLSQMFSRQSGDGADPEEGWYGYGVWIIPNPDGEDFVYFQGCDPGVSFISEYNPNNGMVSVLVSNYGDNVWKEMRSIRRELY